MPDMPKLVRIFNRARNDDRLVNELLGMCNGIIADSVLSADEIKFLQKWLVANQHVSENALVAVLLDRINEILKDDLVTADEAADLFATLRSFVGGEIELGEILKSTSLPLDHPAPSLTFADRHFCFTGVFAYGSRAECESATMFKGAHVGSLTRKTNYLVIGCYANDQWAHSSYGRKIEKAVDYRNRGWPIQIISEEHWLNFIN